MAQENSNKGDKGCAIAVGLLVVLVLVFTFATTSKSEIAETGALIFGIAFLAGIYLAIRAYLNSTKDSKNKFVRIVVRIGIVIALALIGGAMIHDFNSMMVIGAIVIVAFCILMGIWMYNSRND